MRVFFGIFVISVNGYSKTLNTLDQLIQSPNPVSCEELSDAFCDELWSSKSKGNFSYFDDQYLMGSGKNSEINNAIRIDFEAFRSGINTVPLDLQKKIEEPLNKLIQLMENEDSSKTWARKFNLESQALSQKFSEYSEDVVYAQRPDLKEVREEDLSPSDILEFRKSEWKMNKIIVDAKYKNHKNWKRVEALFSVVQNDIIHVIENLNLSSEVKQKMIHEITTIQLSLPYVDPVILGTSSDCGTTEVNAMYMPSKHKFTVCAGYFNTVVSEVNLYLVMAHELAHSIDPDKYLKDHLVTTPFFKLLNQVAFQSLGCSDWSQKKEAALSSEIQQYDLPKEIYQLSQCLVDRSELSKPTQEEILNSVGIISKNTISDFVNSNFATYLITPLKKKYGVEVSNPLFLNPKLLDSVLNGQYMYENDVVYLSPIFVQEYKCQTTSDESIKLEKALQNSRALVKRYLYEMSTIYKEESSLLTSFGFAKASNEDFADWIAQKAFEHSLKSKKSLAEKRRRVASSFALFCARSDDHIIDSKSTMTLEKFKTMVHPNNRIRRLRIYSDFIADDIQCTKSESLKLNSKSCEL